MRPSNPHRSFRLLGLTSRVLATGVCFTALPAMQSAAASDVHFVLQAEPAAAFWLDDPQDQRFTPGFYGAVRPGIALGRIVSLQASYALLATPPADGFSETGGAHFFGGGVRLRPLATLRPESEQLGGLWIDGNLGYVRTGQLDRLGFDAGLGYGFQLTPGFALGPAVRYGQIVQPDNVPHVDPKDAQFLTGGVNFSFGVAPREEPEPKRVPERAAGVAPAPVACVEPEPPVCPDYDKDGVCDPEDRCPTQPGPADMMGCRVDPCTGEPLVVLVQFGFDSAGLPTLRSNDPQTMDPVLSAVARAVAQDPTCRVCVVGYASEEGEAAYNLELSGRRAKAVQGYLVGSGVARKRVPTTGFGETCPLEPETSLSMNRRVEFRRLEEGQSCPTSCGE